VFALLPIEVISGYLYHLTNVIVESFHLESGEDAPELLKVITDPFTKLIIEVSSLALKLSCYTESPSSILPISISYTFHLSEDRPS